MLDPAAGDGVFLDAARSRWPDCRLAGFEIEPTVADRLAAAVPEARIETGDGLQLPGTGPRSVAAVIGNPPFGADKKRGEEPSEIRFLRRFVELTRPGGLVVVILPVGVVANRRFQRLRDELLDLGHVLACLQLPTSVFRGTGTRAETVALLFRPHGGVPTPGPTCLVARIPDPEALPQLPSETGRVSQAQLRGARWDAGFWDPRLCDALDGIRWPIRRLGSLLPQGAITYGVIAPGQRPRIGRGPLYLSQRCLAPTGIDTADCLRLEPDSPFAIPRVRLQRYDLLFPRSGRGLLPRRRMAVWYGTEPAVVDCFVDRIRPVGIDARALHLLLRTDRGFAGIQRLVNGVGPLNISFPELRSLPLPVPDAAWQRKLVAAHDELQRRHQRALESRGQAEQEAAARALHEAVALADRALDAGPPPPDDRT